MHEVCNRASVRGTELILFHLPVPGASRVCLRHGNRCSDVWSQPQQRPNSVSSSRRFGHCLTIRTGAFNLFRTFLGAAWIHSSFGRVCFIDTQHSVAGFPGANDDIFGLRFIDEDNELCGK